MVGHNSKKPQLPKSVLDMKFMKKTKERIQKELDNTQNHESLYSDIITSEMRQATGNFISEASFVYCEDLLEGRVSFKGMNPEIERLMEQDDKKNEPETEIEKDVSDEVMYKKMQAFHQNRKRSGPSDVHKSDSKYSVVKKRKR